MKVLKYCFLYVFCLAGSFALAGDAAAPKDIFTDAAAGYSFKIPEGFERLSDAENKELFRGLSDFLGKEAGERALRQPPAYFKGSLDPKHPTIPPPSLAVGYTDLNEQVDAAKLSEYKSLIEQQNAKKGEKTGELKAEIITVAGVPSLKVEHDIYLSLDKGQAHLIRLLVPRTGRAYEIVFNYSPEQDMRVQPALDTVVKSFKFEDAPLLDAQGKSQWTRIILYTVGGFALGIVLSLLLKVLAGVGEKTVDDRPASHPRAS